MYVQVQLYSIVKTQRMWQSLPRIWLHEYVWMTLIQFKPKRIGQPGISGGKGKVR